MLFKLDVKSKNFRKIMQRIVCCVPGCHNPRGVTYHRVPATLTSNEKDQFFKKLKISVGTEYSNSIRICSDHFTKDSFKAFGKDIGNVNLISK